MLRADVVFSPVVEAAGLDAFAGNWLTRRPRPGLSGAILLFCFPHAGGGASSYRGWPAVFGDRIVPLPVQLPGRESRYDEALITDATTLADAFIAAAASLLGQPYALFGHSMGALIAYEVARRVRVQGLPPAQHLFASGGRAPVLPDGQPPVRDLPEPELIETIRRWNGVPEAVLDHPELLAIVLPVLRADLTLCETYARHPVERLAIPVTAFGGRTDPKVTVAEVEEWKLMTTAGCATRFYDAGHFFLESHLADVLAVVGARLAATTTRPMPVARS